MYDIITHKTGKIMGRRKKNNLLRKTIVTIVIAIFLIIASYFGIDVPKYLSNEASENEISYTTSFDLTTIPEYINEPYVVLNNNEPEFSEEDYTTEAFEKYSELDILGRCGPAFANVCKATMPTEERETLDYEPTGWKQKQYNGEYLYNRCHLIGYQLTAENDNEKNLITGTRYMNVEGMLPFENRVAEYIKNQEENENNHVLYRVTPIYEGENLLASGVQIEAKSVEDNGESICFNVYVYNVQPGITIDYSTGESKLAE